MVTRSVIAAFAVFLAAAPVRADLNLSPRLVDFVGDGAHGQHLVFRDGTGKEISYQPPSGWEFSGSPERLSLRPNHSQAEGIITRQSLARGEALDEESVRHLTLQAVANVPPGSTNIQILNQQKDPVVINQKETFLVAISYTVNGISYGRSLMFMNRGNEQMRFQFTCRLSDFPQLQRAFLASQFTWQNL